METPLLTDPDTAPSPAVLEDALGRTYAAYGAFIETIESGAYGFSPEWRYYRDGKAWLCKITFRKKTVAWLSIWPGCFKVACYFTEQSGAGISNLEISAAAKERYRIHQPIGRLKPLVFEVSRKVQLAEVYCLLHYKAGLG